jgi:hypothetical protein
MKPLPYEPTFWFFPDYGGQNNYYRIRAWVKDYLGIEPSGDK